MHAFSRLSPVRTGKDMYTEEEAKSSSLHALSSCWSGCDRIVGTVKPLDLPVGAVGGSSSDQHGVLSNTCGGSEVSTSGIANFGEVFDSDHTNIAGILYKWVNFGKGWRPRWFILNNGVLSYYKVHGPNKIIFNDTKHLNSRIIGEESQKLIKKQRSAHRRGKAYGEVHLQVSSIHKSSSDSRKFYISTGTKTLHLRAESKEDRNAWLDALISAKNKFQRTCLIEGTVSPFQLAMNTEKLRERLLLEGMPEHVIADCEAIMKMEFDLLLKHLRALEENHLNLLERLKQLEGEKLELETTVIDERQSKGSADDVLGLHGQGESEAETDDDREVQTGVEADSDEDDSAFFDADEFSGSEYFCTPTSLSRQESERSLEAFSDSNMTIPDPPNVCMEKIGFDYPQVERRKRLPEPKEREKSVSLWSMIKDNIGKDLTKICLPVYFNEPISSLQKCFEDLEYSYLLDRAYAWGKQGDHLMQILNVAAFAVSGYSSTKGRTCKPFNPLLGETYEADFPDKGLRFISEKVSHHPMVMACHCEGKGWVFWGDSNLKSKFWGRSIRLDPVGTLTLQFADGRRFQWSKVTTSIYNLIIGKLYVDHYGTMRIHGNGELLCKLKFKEQSVIERNPHQVQGYVYDKLGNKLATLFGKWDEAIYYVQGELALKSKDFDSVSEAALLWRCNDPPEFPTRCNLTSFAITLNEITVGLKEKLPPTDSRLRPDQRHLENGEYELANLEKLRLEQKQRQARKLQERGWQPRWFRRSSDAESYEYIGGYWEAREKSDWTGCPDIFGIDTEQLNL